MASSETMRPLTRSLARQLEIPLSDLLSQHYQRPYRNTYIRSQIELTTARRARLAMSMVKGAHHVSHHTAVRIWGGVAPASASVHVSTATRSGRSRRSGVSSHLANPNARTTVQDGLPLATPTQAFLDLASCGVELLDLVVAGDSLVKATGLKPASFVQAAQQWTGRGAVRAREAAALIRSGVDSPMETRLRLLIVFAGLPEPEVNLKLRDEDGEIVWRLDLAYAQWKVVVEYDGRQHAYDDKQWSSDIERREALERLGWRLIVITQQGIYRNPERTLQRIVDALRDRGAVGLPQHFKADWRRHFPARS